MLMANVRQPVTDDSIKVRQLTHYQFSWVAGDRGKPGTYTLQLVLDEGAWEEVLTWTPTTPTTSRTCWRTPTPSTTTWSGGC
jgi:hypothetical protein